MQLGLPQDEVIIFGPKWFEKRLILLRSFCMLSEILCLCSIVLSSTGIPFALAASVWQADLVARFKNKGCACISHCPFSIDADLPGVIIVFCSALLKYFCHQHRSQIHCFQLYMKSLYKVNGKCIWRKKLMKKGHTYVLWKTEHTLVFFYSYS